MSRVRHVSYVACLCISVGIYLTRIEDSFLEINDTWEIEQDIITTLSQSQEYTLEDYLQRYSEQIDQDVQRMIAHSEDRRRVGVEEHPQKFSPDPDVFKQLCIQSYTAEYHVKMKEWCCKKAKELLIQRVAETYMHHFGLSSVHVATACAKMFYTVYSVRLIGYTKAYTVITPDHELYNSVNFFTSNKTLANAYHNSGEFTLEDLCKTLTQTVTGIEKRMCPLLCNAVIPCKITLDVFNRVLADEETVLSKRRNPFDDIIINKSSMFFNAIQCQNPVLLNAYNKLRMQTETMTYFISELPQIVLVFQRAVFCENRTSVQDILQQQFVKYIESKPCMYRTLFNNKEFKQLTVMYKTVREKFVRKYSRVIPIESDLIALVFGYL